MLADFGTHFLILAFLVALLECHPKLLPHRGSSLLLFLLLSAALAVLIIGFAISDFSFVLVAKHSHTLKPMLYKITGSWGNHEGSLLLLTWIISLYHLVLARHRILAEALPFHSMILMFFIGFLLLTSNPFAVLPVPAVNGAGLNPLLQDIGLAIHPPLLYLGYAGTSVLFVVAISRLLKENFSVVALKAVKKWVLWSVGFLTAGIAMGSWWAYRELGWGGFWFWDPVENVSLIPWFILIALLHTLIVSIKRGHLKAWSSALCILSFLVSLIGFFLVRSGLLTSVHSFASDPTRGMVLLVFFTFVTISGVGIYLWKSPQLSMRKGFDLWSKEAAILIANVFLVATAATIMLGTLYPFILEMASGDKAMVGAPYYAQVFPPLALPLIALAAFAPVMYWEKDGIKRHGTSLLVLLCVALVSFTLFPSLSFVLWCGMVLGAWLVYASVAMVVKSCRAGMVHYFALPLSTHGMILGHLGLGLLAFSLSLNLAFSHEKEAILQLKERLEIGPYEVMLEKMDGMVGDNYVAQIASLRVMQTGELLRPESRYYPVEQQKTTEADIHHQGLHHLYVALGKGNKEQGYGVRIYYKPWMNLLWLSAAAIALGAFIAFFRRESHAS